MSSYKLIYFPFGGRAGFIRMAFYLRGIAYKEEFLTFEQWGEMKKKDDREWTGLPMLSVLDSKSGSQIARMGQSNAILRFAACCPGNNNGDEAKEKENSYSNSLYPKDNPLVCAQIDEILDAVEDLTTRIGAATRGMDEKAKKERREQLWESAWCPFMLKFCRKLEMNNKKNNKNNKIEYVVGNSLTIADLRLYTAIQDWIDGLIDYLDGNKLIMENDKFKILQEYYQFIGKNEKIIAFNKEFNGKVEEWKAKQEKNKGGK